MIHALVRKALADLRSRRLQTVLIMLILILATAVLTVSVALLRSDSTNNPWERIFAETNGAHVWFTSSNADVDLAPIARLDGAAASVGPLPYVWGAFLAHNHGKYGLGLYGTSAVLPLVGRPSVSDGNWLAVGGENEMVLDRGLALSLKLNVGDTVVVVTSTGKATLHVVGLAVNPGQGPFPSVQPGLGYVLPTTLTRLEPDKRYWQWKLGVRLADPKTLPDFLKSADALFLAGGIADANDWGQARYLWLHNASNPTFNLWLVFVGVFTLVAVGFVIANVIGGIVLSQYREIGLLKAVGTTPGQVALLFLLEYLGLGCVAGVIGLGLGVAIAPIFLRPAAELLNVSPVPAFDPLSLLSILLGVETVVAVFTLLPARRGGRISTVQAITTGFARVHHRPSRLARLAARLRLPPFLALGLKDTFARPMRAWLTIGALVLTVVIMVVVLVGTATIRNLIAWATPYDMIVQRGFLSAAETQKILEERPEIGAYYTEARVSSKAAGQATTFPSLALGGAYSQFVHVSEGRLFRGRNEAVVTQGLLDQLGLKIGEELHLKVNGRLLDLHIVGLYYDMGVGTDNRIAAFSLEALQHVDPEARPADYYLKLAPGADPKALEANLIRLSSDQFKTVIIDREEMLSEGGSTWMVLYGLNGILLIIGIVSLLITTLLGVRERRRDFGIFKTIGLTPGQIVAGVIAGVSPLALLAVTIAIPLGVWITRVMSDYFGRLGGTGAGTMALPDWWWFVLTYPAALLLAALGGFIPARRAAAVKVVEVLRYE
jgi:putative ABC transport system permease protein